MRWVGALCLSLAASGCAWTSVSAPRGKAPEGVRLYPPQVLLFVDAPAEGRPAQSALVVVPNLAEPYDVRPVAFLSRNDFKVEVKDGMLESLDSGLDTASAFAIVRSARGLAELATRAAPGVGPREVTVLPGSFGLSTGIYLLGPDWTFTRLQTPQK